MKSSEDLATLLKNYEKYMLPFYAEEQKSNLFEEEATLKRFYSLLDDSPACFARSHLPGHYTASAFVLNKNMDKVILTHHKKLGKWLQLGGHADQHPYLYEVALKEAQEESGIDEIKNYSLSSITKQDSLLCPFDMDIHMIPASPKEPQHNHYDLRFVFITEQNDLQISEESNDLSWVSLSEIDRNIHFKSVCKMLNKIRKILSKNFVHI